METVNEHLNHSDYVDSNDLTKENFLNKKRIKLEDKNENRHKFSCF